MKEAFIYLVIFLALCAVSAFLGGIVVMHFLNLHCIRTLSYYILSVSGLAFAVYFPLLAIVKEKEND